MKTFQIEIEAYALQDYFKPIRKKTDIWKIILNLIKLIPYNYKQSIHDPKGKITIYVSKISRVIFETEQNLFSLYFPFTVIDKEDSLIFLSKSGIEISSSLSSQMLSIIDEINENDLISFQDLNLIPENFEYENENALFILNELLLQEDGYLRFDHDIENADGNLHPEKHIDIFFQNASKVKLGLNNTLDHSQFLDILNTETDCWYLK
ncbi:hypothetical protein [Leptospira mtsangambouensis]|uniref:hypothetical protein n=1 Tax=Leptospira mtsangambouensis TaxID=2484912 RepID=UPI001EEAD5AB|nr:hypothetical protein [Leptospira mtsangambouensis]MCG6142737.1 hypothetical protein [Leptospira mtsangambouensis]